MLKSSLDIAVRRYPHSLPSKLEQGDILTVYDQSAMRIRGYLKFKGIEAEGQFIGRGKLEILPNLQ